MYFKVGRVSGSSLGNKYFQNQGQGRHVWFKEWSRGKRSARNLSAYDIPAVLTGCSRSGPSVQPRRPAQRVPIPRKVHIH